MSLQLPSHKFRHTVWHELRSTQVTGDQLRAPRVREGPESKEETFYVAADNAGKLIHHDRTGQERVRYRDNQENWETAVVIIIILITFIYWTLMVFVGVVVLRYQHHNYY